ncbi:MAG: dCTP deaminase [Nanoarchaeota archaeon]|nr:dCTP deaminase [Nanoarchaeota archaeon]MBU2520101.1 dCTP deaminase [Nanoarchaeota archaeon]
MILPDHEIKKLLAEGKIKIEPLSDPELQIQPAGVDLRLSNKFRVFKLSSIPFIDTKKQAEDYTEVIEVDDEKGFIIHPGEFVLGSVKEYIKISDDLVGSVDGRSSLGRLGISIHTTSSSINPGWEGTLVLEISNIGKMPVVLYPGMRIAKLALHKLSSPAERPYNVRKTKYHGQDVVQESKVHEDFTNI